MTAEVDWKIPTTDHTDHTESRSCHGEQGNILPRKSRKSRKVSQQFLFRDFSDFRGQCVDPWHGVSTEDTQTATGSSLLRVLRVLRG